MTSLRFYRMEPARLRPSFRRWRPHRPGRIGLQFGFWNALYHGNLLISLRHSGHELGVLWLRLEVPVAEHQPGNRLARLLFERDPSLAWKRRRLGRDGQCEIDRLRRVRHFLTRCAVDTRSSDPSSL